MMLFQKFLGAVIMLIGLLSIIPTRDITAAVMFVPLGAYVLFTRKKLCDIEEEDGDNGIV